MNLILGRRGSRFAAAAGTVIIMASPVLPAAQQEAPVAPRFASVSIRPFRPGARVPYTMNPARLSLPPIPLLGLVRFAYGFLPYQILAPEDWERKQLWILNATSAQPSTPDQAKLMLRAALADRFGLKLTHQPHTMAVYALQAAPGGPKLRQLKFGERPTPPPPGASPSGWITTIYGDTLFGLTGYLNELAGKGVLSRPVVDQTGLTGRYNVWLMLPAKPGIGVRPVPDEREVPAALEREFGLRLVPSTQSVEVYTIASAHRPTPN